MALTTIITTHQRELLDGWLAELMSKIIRRDKNAKSELRQQGGQFLSVLAGALGKDGTGDIEAAAWDEVRQLLTEISQSRVRQGFLSIQLSRRQTRFRVLSMNSGRTSSKK